MKNLKIALWIAAIGCLTAVPFIVLPWSVVERIILWFGIEPIPDNLIVMYMFRTACGVYGLIGVFFLLLAKDPLRYGPMLDLGAYGLVIFGVLSLFAGVYMHIPLVVYGGDALSGIILGIAIRIFSYRAGSAST